MPFAPREAVIMSRYSGCSLCTEARPDEIFSQLLQEPSFTRLPPGPSTAQTSRTIKNIWSQLGRFREEECSCCPTRRASDVAGLVPCGRHTRARAGSARDFAYRLLEQWQNIAFQFQIEYGTCSGVVQFANSPAFHHEDVVHPEVRPADGEGELISNLTCHRNSWDKRPDTMYLTGSSPRN